jgi:hypothetical protein
MAPPRKQKVLICGDVNGDFSTLLARTNALMKSKAGPFDAMFIVGSLFPGTAEDAMSEEVRTEKLSS